MLVGTFGAIATLIVFLSYAHQPAHRLLHAGHHLRRPGGLPVAASSPRGWPGYTETVEAKNPALVATGLALWGWILRLVVGISFIFLPLVITSVNPVVDNQPVRPAR